MNNDYVYILTNDTILLFTILKQIQNSKSFNLNKHSVKFAKHKGYINILF